MRNSLREAHSSHPSPSYSKIPHHPYRPPRTGNNTPEKYITLGLKIAYFRRKAGFTQEHFAELIGKSVSFVGQIEGTGTVRGVSLETLFKIAQVLKVPPSKLLEDD